MRRVPSRSGVLAVCALSFFLALTVPLLVPGTSWSLTIYRIGGSDRPSPPEAELEGVEFVPLSWEAAAQGFDGKMQGLALGEAGDRARPSLPG